MIEETAPAALAGERIDRAVALITGCTRGEASRLIDSAEVRVNGRIVTKAAARLAEGDLIAIEDASLSFVESLSPDATVAYDLVYADDEILVVDKPPDLVVHPGAGTSGSTLVQGLIADYPDLAAVGEPQRPGVVHRLDRGTSGVMVVARTEAARADLVSQLAGREVDRRYTAVVWGHVENDEGLIDAPIGRSQRNRTRMAVSAEGREARTRYHVEKRCDDPADVTVLTCRLETGRTHQIRVHVTAIGHPIVGDLTYGGSRESIPFGRPALHAGYLAFRHPGTGDDVMFEAGPPLDMEDLLDSLG
ncbi:MAG: RluA family pseudouridine synthase [Acidimicrobiales bacterium]